MENNNTTPFSIVYNKFLTKITDDMYMELTKKDTYRLLEELLLSAIQKFEFPRVNIFDYQVSHCDCHETTPCEDCKATHCMDGFFNCVLTEEEANILATYMIVEWIGQQLASIENTRMKYSGSDFKFTSQANHMQKLLAIKSDYDREGFHLQRLYKRRRPNKHGVMRSTFGSIMAPLGEGYYDD